MSGFLHRVRRIFHEKISGTTANRPQLKSYLRWWCSQYFRRDSLSRDTIDLLIIARLHVLPLEGNSDLILGWGEHSRAARVEKIRALSGRTIGWHLNYDYFKRANC